METIGFIGAYDKTDLILNLSKILTCMEKRILIIDTTINQKAKYIVPFINPTTTYITNFEDMDIAVGFENLEQIKDYLGDSEELPYDILLIDIDTNEKMNVFNIQKAQKNFFVTAFDLYSLKKGMEILSNLEEPISLTKVLFSKDMLKEDDDYLNFLSLEYKVIWSEYKIFFPLENGDLSVIMDNQRAEKIKFKRLSVQYKDGLLMMVQEILKDASEGSIRKVIKSIEKGV